MSFDEIAALRPSDGSSAAIADAITRAESALSEKRQLAAELQSRRAELLLTASDPELQKIEGDAPMAVRDADRIEALLGTLRDQISAARQREEIADLRDRHRRAAEALAAHEGELRRVYPECVQRLAALIEQEQAALRLVGDYEARRKSRPDLVAAAPGGLPTVMREVPIHGIRRRFGSLKSFIRLPGAGGLCEPVLGAPLDEPW